MLGPLRQNQNFFEGPTPPFSKVKFPPYRQNSRLSTQGTFFLIAPRDLHYFGGAGEHVKVVLYSKKVMLCCKSHFF